MPEHPFNNFNNNTLEGTVENLENRPRHIYTAIDWFFESEKFARALKADSNWTQYWDIGFLDESKVKINLIYLLKNR